MVLYVSLCLSLPLSNLEDAAMVSYQGQVVVDNAAYDGTGYFKLAVVNAAGDTSYWSNDGTSSDGSEPTNAVPLTVDHGLFEILLGDTSISNMTQPMSASVFDNTGRYLRIWFCETESGTYTQLSPDQQIVAVPYALQAEEAKTAGDADTLDGQEGNAYQNRVSGTCEEGNTITSINADGSVECELHNPLPVHSITALDTSGDIGPTYKSITIGADGLPIISYYDATNDNLKVAHCDNIACTSASVSTVDSAGNVGRDSSITIGVNGLPIISYADSTNGHLKIAYCSNVACSGATLTALDTSGDGVRYTSITIGISGRPIISYQNTTNLDLQVASCDNTDCSSVSLYDLDTTGDYTSITIGADGYPIISYQDTTNGALKVAHCAYQDCSAGITLTSVDTTGFSGGYTSIAIGIDDLPIISHQDGDVNDDLRVAHCDNITCTSATNSAVDTAGDVGRDTSIAIGSDGLPIISYYEYGAASNLKVAHCTNVSCTSATTSTLDYGPVGRYGSITIGVDGLPVIAYYDLANDNLKVAHCSNTLCLPYWRRR